MVFAGFEEVSSAIVDQLSAAGWSQTRRSKDSGVPDFFYDSNRMRVLVFQSIEGRSLMLTLIDTQKGGHLRFDIRYEESILSLLGILVEWQNSVTVDSFRDMLRSISLEIPETYAEPFEGDEDAPWQKVIPGR